MDEALLKIATELVECALDSTNPNFQFAVREIGLRLDGKPKDHIDLDTTQPLVNAGISDAYAILIEAIKRH
jgi:hypothetical protein